MKGLCWNSFKSQAQMSICRDCEFAHDQPWRGNTSCLQTWLRFHASRGIILSCHASRTVQRPVRVEDRLMSTGNQVETPA